MSASIESTIAVVCLLANIFAIARLWQLKLVPSYPVLLIWLCAALPNDFALAFWGPRNLRYFFVFVFSEPFLLVLYLAVVRMNTSPTLW